MDFAMNDCIDARLKLGELDILNAIWCSIGKLVGGRGKREKIMIDGTCVTGRVLPSPFTASVIPLSSIHVVHGQRGERCHLRREPTVGDARWIYLGDR